MNTIIKGIWLATIACIWTMNAIFGQSGNALLNLAKSELEHHSRHQKQALQVSAVNGANIDVVQYRAHWLLNPQSDSIRGKVAIVFRPVSQPVNQTSLDLASNMVIESVKFRNVPVQFSFAGASTLNLNFGNQQLNPGNTDSLVIRYRGKPYSSGLGSFNRYQHAGTWLIYSLSEPYGAKDWWPCKQSLNDKADSIDITIYTPPAYTAVSNGLLVSQGQANGLKAFRWKHKYPIATYLIAIASTNYAFFRHHAVLANGDTLPVDNYCYPENLNEWQTNMQSVTHMIEDFDSLLAPYPFAKEKYGHTQFAFGGGMEHQTNSFMQNTDYGLQAHELAHQWFGDKVTCHSWQDIWLNEGFATYLAALEYVNAGFSSWPQEGRQWIDYIATETGGSVFCSDTSDVYRIFSGRLTYAKGAMLIRMLRWKLGETAFWQGIRNYIGNSSNAYGFVRTSDLRGNLENSSGENLGEFFNDWYKGEGFPQIQVDAMIDADSVKVTLFQQPSHPSVSFFEMDVPLKIKNGNGDTLVRLPFTQNGQTYTIRTNSIIDSIKADPESQWLAQWNVSQITSRNKIKQNIPAMFFPNPFRNQIIFRKGMEDILSASLMDLNGKLILTLSTESDGISTPTEYLPPGTYILQTSTRTGLHHRLFVRE
jgi:aminopeptidase N